MKAFRLFDDDEIGVISFKILKRVAKELGERMTDDALREGVDWQIARGPISPGERRRAA